MSQFGMFQGSPGYFFGNQPVQQPQIQIPGYGVYGQAGMPGVGGIL
jgi:hypothetical protein